MTFLDDDRPRKPVDHEIGQDLSTLSVDELDRRIAILREEIERIETERATKASGRAAAEGLFR